MLIASVSQCDPKRSVAWRGAHWGGAHWRYGWRTGRGWNRWGWNRGWGAGWPGYAGLGLAGFGLGWGLNNAWAGYPYYGYPYNYAYGYGYPYGYGLGAAAAAPVAAATVAEATTAPLVTGWSVATGQMGNYCTTPARWPGYAGLGLAGFGSGWGLNNAWAGYPYYGYPYNTRMATAILTDMD